MGTNPPKRNAAAKPWWRQGWVQVLIAAALGAFVGAVWPTAGLAVKPFADIFISLIKFSITPLIFLVVCSGVAQVGDMRKIGRIGLKALIYFEMVSSVALLVGITVSNLVDFGANVNRPTAEQAGLAAHYSGAHAESVSDILLKIIPDNFFGAFVHNNVLQVLFIALLVGAALVRLGEAGAPIRNGLERCTRLIFGVVNIIVMIAPLAAFGALGFSVAKFGVSTLYALGEFVLTAWVTLAAVVLIEYGLIARLAGIRLSNLIRRLKGELLMVAATSSSEVAIPGMMERLEASGVSRSTLGLVIPTGYSFNLDGVAITLPMSVMFIAQVYGIHLDFGQQASLFVLMMLTSKGAAGVSGGAFAALAATVIAAGLPAEGLALLLGVDRFMSQGRSIINTIANALAAVVVARWEGEFDAAKWAATRDGLPELSPPPASETEPESDLLASHSVS